MYVHDYVITKHYHFNVTTTTVCISETLEMASSQSSLHCMVVLWLDIHVEVSGFRFRPFFPQEHTFFLHPRERSGCKRCPVPVVTPPECDPFFLWYAKTLDTFVRCHHFGSSFFIAFSLPSSVTLVIHPTARLPVTTTARYRSESLCGHSTVGEAIRTLPVEVVRPYTRLLQSVEQGWLTKKRLLPKVWRVRQHFPRYQSRLCKLGCALCHRSFNTTERTEKHHFLDQKTSHTFTFFLLDYSSIDT